MYHIFFFHLETIHEITVGSKLLKKNGVGRAISVVILTTTPIVSGSDAYVHIGGIITVRCEYKVVLVFLVLTHFISLQCLTKAGLNAAQTSQ